MNGNPLQKKRPGDKFRFPASTFNTFIDTAITVQRMQQTGGQQEPRQFRLCRVVIEGPDAAVDYEDHRYWVQEVAATDATFATWGSVGDEPFTAINLLELGADIVLQHHLVRDRQDIDDDVVTEYDIADPVFVVVYYAGGQWVFSALRLDPIRRQYLHIDAFDEDGAPTAGKWETVVLVGIVEDTEVWPLVGS